MADAQALAHIIYTVFPCIDQAGKFLMQRGWDEVNMCHLEYLSLGYTLVRLLLRQGEGDVIFDGDEEVSAIQPAQTGVQGKSEHVPYAHQNLKPGNIMITDDGVTPILMDFSMKFELELLKRAGGWGNGCGVVAIETEGIRHAICDMSLLIFNLVLLTFTFKSMDVCKAARILEWNLKRYPNGACVSSSSLAQADWTLSLPNPPKCSTTTLQHLKAAAFSQLGPEGDGFESSCMSLLQLLYATESQTAKKLKQIVKLRA
ncbi:hypothetical protein EV424DRAFT_1345295 [Suillus variegatus]|nr:hypothetical protein EV424DRAFT_1345295 [Suillus variegatus]